MSDHEFVEDVVEEEDVAELERLETLERHGMLTHAADRNALEAHREKYGTPEADEEEDEDASE